MFRAGNLGELINALPALFGFPPENSLVTLGMEGPRIAFGMRIDLAEVGDDAVDKVADLAVRHLEHQHSEGAIVLALGDPLDRGRRLVLAVEARLVRVQPVAGGWATDDRYWVSMAGGSPRGYPYRRSLDHPASTQAMWEGQEIAPSRASIEASMAPVAGPRRVELDAAAERVAAVHVGDFDDIVPVLHDLQENRPVDDDRLLQLGLLATSIPVRDQAWALITSDNARDFVRVWLHVARHVPHDWSPAAYCLAAFAAWLSGDGAKAVMAAEYALRIDRGYSMAALMIELATCGMNPKNWVGFGPA